MSLSLPKVWVLTVNRPIARYDVTAQHLTDMGIPFERFNGFDNLKTRLSPIDTFDLDRAGERIGPKHIAATLSHMAIWYVMLYQPDDAFIVFEYDILLQPDFVERFYDEMSVVPDDWDIIMLGSCCAADKQKTHVDKSVYWIKEALCGHAMLYRKKALPILIEEQQRIYAPLDIGLVLGAFKKLDVYAIIPSLVGQRGTPLPP